MKAAPTVFVVDDDPGMRRSLVHLLRSVELPVEVFDTAYAFLEDTELTRPGCLVLDVRMPFMTGLEMQQALAARDSAMPVIILTGYADVRTAVQALKAGAFDFVEKPFQNHQFLDIIQSALRRDHELRLRRAQRLEVESRLATLTAGERRVLDAMMSGKCYKTIAKELDISYKTVQARRAQIMKKMEVDDLPALAHLVILTQFECPVTPFGSSRS